MASALHEGLAHLVRDRPALLIELLRSVAHSELPPHDLVAVHSGDLGSPRAVELRADAAFRLERDGAPVLGVVSEIQLTIDAAKLFSFPSYVTGLRSNLRCDVVLVVITNDRAVAAWARRPIPLGPGTGFVQAVVLGPDEVPPIVDAASARRDPDLAALAAVAHGRDDDVDQAVAGAVAALQAVFDVAGDRSAMYYDLIQAGLSEAARKAFAMLPEGYQYQDEGMRRAQADGIAKGEAKGIAKGKAEGVLAVLDARGLPVSAQQRARILGCADVADLDVWLRRAVTVAGVDDLFAH